jgi:flagellar hook-length control protein FliK
MSTANAVSRPAESPRPAQSAAHSKAAAEKPAEPDLFASLLNLVSDTRLEPDATPLPAEPSATDAPAEDAEEPNPLTALLAWATPASAAATPANTGSSNTTPASATAAPASTTAPALGKETALPAAGKPEAGGVDITGMTPVVDEKIAAADLAAPASAPARPAFATPAARPAFASRMETPAQAGAPAMVWQRGAVSSTDALQQQFASQAVQQPHHAPLSSVRSTVALDERFTLTSVLNTSTTPREAGAELVLPGGGGARTAAFEAAPGVASPTGAEGGATGDSMGGSSGDTLPGDQTGQGQDGTRAEREAEGPTVSHWGTQHLRHASLRVGESGTDAIDIQLSMKGQEVQVAFQSDNAEARASLRESASDALTELLQRSGIQLGNVSVGTQGQQQGGHSPQTPTVSRGETIGKAEPAVATPPSPRPSPRADGSQPLDLFV